MPRTRSPARRASASTRGSILLYGSVARGEERGVHSDVDSLVVLSDGVDDAATVEHDSRDLAYDVELEYGVVLS